MEAPANQPSAAELKRAFLGSPLNVDNVDAVQQQENPVVADPIQDVSQAAHDGDDEFLYDDDRANTDVDDEEVDPTQKRLTPVRSTLLASPMEDDEGSKRLRHDDNPPSDASEEEEAEHGRDLIHMQLETITVLPQNVSDKISRTAFSLHTKWLLRNRQTAEIVENVKAERVPKVFTSNVKKVTFGEGAEAVAHKMEEEELQHQLKMSEYMAKGKELEANDFHRKSHALLEDATNEQMARV